MSRRGLLPLLAATVLLAACGSSAKTSSSPAKTPARTGTGTGTTPTATTPQLGFEGVAIEPGQAIAPASSTQTGTVDGIQCGSKEQLVYHIHIHLAVFVDGQPRSLPGGIGIPGSQVVATSQGPYANGGQCIYWLHTHAPDGIIHVESPSKRVYTLGNFFDEWHQPLSKTQIGTISGQLTFVVGGKPWTRDPRQIPLLPREVVQVDTGQPAPPFTSVDWSQTGL